MRITSTPSARATVCLAAAALLVTGCASRQASSSGSAASKLPKLLIANTADGAAPAALAPTGGGGPENRMKIFGGYVIAGTLPDQPTHAPIYLWPSTKPSQSDVEKLASVLGLSGMPTRHAYGWELTTAAGDLRVRDDQGQRWFYSRADQSPCDAANFDIDELPGDAPHGMCATASSAGTPANGPDEAATKAAAARLLTALGVAGDDEFSAGAPTSSLNVSPKVGGLPTQGTDRNVTYINVDARGITAATGPLHAPTAGDDYPLQTAKAAFDSLAARPQPMIAMYCGPHPGEPNRFGGVGPSAVAPPTPVEVPPATCPTPEPIEITGAHLGLTIEYNATTAGAAILVPVWIFTLADDSVATTAIAVDPAYLGAPPQPSDVATAGVASGGPGFSSQAVPPVGPTVAPSADGPSVGAPATPAVAPKPASS